MSERVYPREEMSIYMAAAFDALGVLQLAVPQKIRYIEADGGMDPAVQQAIQQLVDKAPEETRVRFLDSQHGRLHEMMSKAYNELVELAPTINQGTIGKQRVMGCIGRLIYYAVNLRLPDHLFEVHDHVAWKFSRDIHMHLDKLPFKLDRNPPRPIPANHPNVVEKQCEDFLVMLMDDMEDGYMYGNGYPANPKCLNNAYDGACNYICSMLASVKSLKA